MPEGLAWEVGRGKGSRGAGLQGAAEVRHMNWLLDTSEGEGSKPS